MRAPRRQIHNEARGASGPSRWAILLRGQQDEGTNDPRQDQGKVWKVATPYPSNDAIFPLSAKSLDPAY